MNREDTELTNRWTELTRLWNDLTRENTESRHPWIEQTGQLPFYPCCLSFEGIFLSLYSNDELEQLEQLIELL